MTEEDSRFARKRILIEFINHETDQFDVEQKRHGWSTRALLVALATLVWLLASQMPLTSVNWQNVGLLFFTLVLTISFIDSFSSTVSMQFGKVSEEPRFFLTSLFGIARKYILTRFVLCLILFFVGIQLRMHIFGISKILILILLAFDAAASLIALIFSFRHIPFSKFLIRKSAPFYSFLSTVPMIIALAGYYVALAKNLDSFSPSDIKVALLLTLITTTFALMGRMPIMSPILPSLDSIRKNLVLNKIDVDRATSQLDIALSGMKVGDLLQENVKEILDQYDAINNVLKQTTEDSKAIESLISHAASNVSVDELKNISRATGALFDKKDKQGEDLVALQKKLSESVKKYQAKAGQIIVFDKRASKAIDEVSINIEKAGEETQSWFKTDEEARAKIKVEIEKLHNIPENPLQLPPRV
ncbi:MAG: hypothetical protein NT006_10020 [Candidatus Aminicenantes bacterium]|nr:hypothetical protein [Candidatus Aminicenantes bacterium]